MNRAIALALLAILSYPLIATAWLADGQRNLPACCRRDGRHHCSMMDPADASGEPKIRSNAARCPLYPAPAKSTAAGASLLAVPSLPVHPALQPAPRIERPPVLRAETSVRGSLFDRGPPAAPHAR